jgi:CshA-type fibril repeat protein
MMDLLFLNLLAFLTVIEKMMTIMIQKYQNLVGCGWESKFLKIGHYVLDVKFFLALFIQMILVVSASSQVNETLFLSDPSQSLDRVDPVSTIDNTNAITSTLNPIIYGAITDSITSLTYSGDKSVGPLGWTSDWIETELNPPGGDPGGASGGFVLVDEFPPLSGLFDLGIIDISVGDNIIRSFDLTGVDSAEVIVNVGSTYGIPNNSDIWRISISSDGGTSYTTLVDLNKNDANTPFSLPLSTFTSNMVLKYELISNAGSNGTGMTIKDFAINYRIPASGPETFTMTTPFCEDYTLSAGQNFNITTYASITYGTVPASPDIDAVLEYGTGPTTIIDLSGTTPTWDGSSFSWSGTIPSNVTIPAGEEITLKVTNNDPSFSCDINFDSQTYPSSIELPTLNKINIDSHNVYDASYSGGSIITEQVVGSTVYIRSTVSNPFGAYDIENYEFTITDPNSAFSTYTATEVASSGCTKTYEYVWNMPTIGGGYSIIGTAYSGGLGVSDKDTIPFLGLIPVQITKTLISPAVGPYTIDDILVYNIKVQNSSALSITTLPLQDIYEDVCLEYVTSSVAPQNVANGSILWNDLGTLTAYSSTNLNVTFKVIGNCEPTRNIAKIEGAIYNSIYALPVVYDTIDIAVDEPPVALDDLFHISSLSNLAVLDNDSDPDNDMVTLSIISGPSSGSASINGVTVDFNPSGMNEDETVTFRYRICDNASPTPYCSEADVTVVYSAINNPPSLTNDIVSTSINLEVLVDVLANDSDIDGDLDISSLSISVDPQFGSSFVNPDGTITYIPNNDYFGSDQFTYTICDNGSPMPAECSIAVVDISIVFVHYVCKSSNSTISVPAVIDADLYVWDLPAGAFMVSGGGTNQVVVDFSSVIASNFNICVEPSNFCGPGTEQCVEIVIIDINIISDVNDAQCQGGDSGAIDITLNGGVSPFIYNWSNGTSVEDLSAIPAGLYSVTVTDRYGCTVNTSETVSEPTTSVFITGAVITDENPYGSNNGEIDITVSGGTPGYSFIWTNTLGQLVSSSEDPVGLSGGTYRVVVTDSNGCSDSKVYTINTIGGPLTINALINTDINCFGGTTGAINLEVIGGSGFYTYDWDTDGTGDFDDPQDLNNISAGTYTVVVDDGVNPTVSSSVDVLEPVAPLSVSALAVNLTCFGGNGGSIDVTANGGTAPYSYKWNTGDVNEDLTGIAIGNYSVSVTDYNGCEIIVSESISQPAKIEISGIATNDVCGLISNGSIDISVSGGIGSYTFQWSNGETTEDVSSLSEGLYSVVVIDGSGCEKTATFTVEKACLGISKKVVGIPINNGDGSYLITYQIVAENYGVVAIDSIQILENLGATFNDAISFSFEDVTIISQPSQGWILNANFDGDVSDGDPTDLTDDHLLGAFGELLIGERGVIQVAVTVVPGAILTYNNSAIGKGTSTLGKSITDLSQDGDDADPDNDGDPTNNNDPTPVTLTEDPIIGLAKKLGPTVTNNQDGTYTLSFELKVQNVGDILLDSIEVSDDLQLTFPGLNISGVGISIVEQPVSTVLILNGGYDGLTAGDINLLDGTGSLVVNEFARFKIDLIVEIDGSLGIFYNTSLASGVSPAGNNVSDISQDGIEVDPDNDGDPTNNNDPTPVIFLENPIVNIIKKLEGTPINNGDGLYSIKYYLEISNQGNVPLLNLQVVDDLNAAFPGLTVSNGSISIVTQPLTTTLVSNINYNGLAAGDIDLLNPGGRLNVGELLVLEMDLIVALNGSLGPFTNLATAAGNGPGGTPTSDDDDEIIVLTESPSLGVAKTVDLPVNNQNGTYSLNYTILVENTGEVTLRNLQIEDDLSSTFEIAPFTITNVTSSTLNVNGSFNGLAGSDTNLLGGTDSLNVGQSATIVVSMTVTPGSKLGIYYNSAIGTAFGSGGTMTTDVSQNGTDVDPDNDGDPTNNNDPTPVSFLENPIIGLAKDIVTSVTNNMDGSFSFVYEIRVENMGDVPLYNVQAVDDLALTFALADGFNVDGYSITQQPSSGGWSTSASFNGSTEINLLSGTGTLNAGHVAKIQIQMTVTPGNFGGPYWNSAIGFGTSPAGRTVSDYSQDGLDVDPDNDGIPTNNNDPTPVEFFILNTTNAEDDYNQTLINVPVYGDLSTNDFDLENDNQTLITIAYDNDGNGIYESTIALPASGSSTSDISGFDQDGIFVLNAGSITVNNNGTYEFIPTMGFTGTASMRYHVIDDNFLPKMDDAILVIDVTGPNINNLYPPIAQDDNATTAPDINVDIVILINDSDVDGFLVESTIDLDPATPGTQIYYATPGEGEFTVNHITGLVTFDPEPTFIGTTTPIDYQVCDNDGLCDDALITVVIADFKDNTMTAEDDSNSGYSGEILTGNILINDIDPDGSDGFPDVNSATLDSDGNGIVNDVLALGTTTVIYGQSANTPGMYVTAGTLKINNDGSYIYTSDSLFEGTIYVPYEACDNDTDNACARATLYLTTTKENSTIAEDDFNQTIVNVSVRGDVSTNDWDPEGDNQTVTSALIDADGDGLKNEVLGIGSTFTLYGENRAGVTVVAGVIKLNSDGTYDYDPATDFVGTVELIYTATDDNGHPASDDAKLVIDVAGPNVNNLYPPIALDDNATTEPDVNVEIPVLDNDSDVDGVIVPSTLDLDPSIAGLQMIFTVPNEGTFTIITSPSTSEQVVLFDPEIDFRGTTTPIDYRICDNDALCDEAWITVLISDPTINEMSAEDDANSKNCSGGTLTGNILSNDIDPDGSTGTPDVSIALVDSDGDGLVNDTLVLGTETNTYSEDANNPGVFILAGTITLNRDGTYIFVSDHAFEGTLYIPYTACDNDVKNACDNATLYLTIARDNAIVEITGSSILCIGATTNLTPSGSGTWTSSDLAIATVSNSGLVTAISAGSVNFTYTDNEECVSDATLPITINETPTVSVTGSNSICEGFTTQLSPTTGGTWISNDLGVATVDSSGLVIGVSPGSTTFVFTNSTTGCISNATQLIIVNLIPTALANNSGPITCIDTSITLTASPADMTYAWSGGGTGATKTVSTAGTYTVTVTSAAGCSDVTSTTVTLDNTIPSISISGDSTICKGSTTIINASTSGTWTSDDETIATISAAGVVLGINAGVVNISFIADNDCAAPSTIQITVTNKEGVTITGDDILCTGASTSLTASKGGGTWASSNDSIATVNTSGVVTAVSAGVVLISYIHSSNSCIENSNITIEVFHTPTVSISGSSEVCAGETTMLSTDGTGGYWTSSDNTIAIASSTGLVLGISAGDVTFYYTTGNNCPSPNTGIITVTPPVSVAIDFNGSECITENAQISAIVTGGTSGFTYAWIGPGGFTGNTQTIDLTIDGNYDVTITDSKGCTDMTSAFIYKAYEPFIFALNTTVCEGESITLSINGASATSYQWSTSADSDTTQSVTVIPSVPSTSYAVTVTNSIGCSTEATADIMVDAKPIVNITGSTDICEGNNTQLSPTTGGIWTSGNSGVASVTDAGLVTGISNGATTFTFKSDVTSCVSEPTGIINVIANETVIITGDNQICFSDNPTLTTSVIGGDWSSSISGIVSIDTNGVVSPLGQGTTTIIYEVTSDGCYNDGSYDITINNNPTISLNGPSTICEGDNTFVNSSITGSWSSSNDSIAMINSTGDITGVSGGNATISFISGLGCTAVLSTPITVISKPVISNTGPAEICINSTTTLSPTTGGTWISSNGSVASVSSNGTVTGTGSGIADFSFIESTNGCLSDETITITVYGPPSINGLSTSELCIGETSSITPSTGGTWASTDTSVATIINNGVITAIGGGAARFIFTSDATGCSSAQSAPLIVNGNPVINVTGLTSFCKGEQSSISPTSGGQWSSTDVTVATIAQNGTITGVNPGTVTFIYTSDLTGCVSDPSTPLTVEQPTEITLTGPSSICVNETTSILPNTGGTWTSSNINIATISSNGAIVGHNSGIVTFTFDSDTACISDPSIGITVISNPVVEFSGPSEICIGSTTNLSPNSGGIWTSSNTGVATVDDTGLVTAIGSGSAQFTFENTSTGCEISTDDSLSVYTKPVPEIIGANEICIGHFTYLTPTSGGDWSSSNTDVAVITSSGQVLGIAVGTATFTFYETGSNCVSDASLPVTVLQKAPVSIDGDNAICVGETTTVLPNTGGSWVSNNTTVATVTDAGVVTGISLGIAKFTFVSDGGCESNETSPVIVYDAPTVSINGPSQVCIDEQVQMLPSSGGTWVSSDTLIATIEDNGLATVIAPGEVNFTFTDGNTGCTSDPSDNITVIEPPTTGLNGPADICIENITYLIPSTGGIWTTLDPGIAIIQNNGQVSGVSPGLARFVFTELSTGCDSEVNNDITINSGPTINFTGPTSICEGDTTNITSTNSGTWESTNPLIATITIDGSITGGSAGSVKFRFTETISGCISDLSETLIVNGPPTVSLAGSPLICIGTTTSLIPSTGGTWGSLTPSIATVTEDGIITGVAEGTAFFVFTDELTGCKSDGNLSVDVASDVGAQITGDSEICTGYTTTLFPNTGGVWLSSNAAIATVSNFGIVKGKAPGIVTFTFVDSNSGCSAGGTTDPITVSTCLNHDFNVALVDQNISGNISTNDNFTGAVTYSNIKVTVEKPLVSLPELNINSDGKYTFVTNKPGKYLYKISVCIPPMISGCPSAFLEINVIDNVSSQSNPVSNLEFATTYTNSNETLPGNTITVNPLSNDDCVYSVGCSLDNSTLSIIDSPQNGSVMLSGTGNFDYTPNPGFIGHDTIVYKVCVSASNCSQSRQIITVNASNALNSVVAADDFAYSLKGIAKSGNVADNDMDPENDEISVIQQGSMVNPILISEGSYYINNDGSYEFTPNATFFGVFEIVYTICDNNTSVACTDATLHIQVFDDISLHIRIYLEGALMNNGNETTSEGKPMMKDNLRVNPFNNINSIPLVDPYSTPFSIFSSLPTSFNQLGPHELPQNVVISDSVGVFSVTGDNAIVDWVHVELRSKDNMNNAFASRSGLIQRDGDIVDVDGVSLLRFQGVNVDSFYVVVKHRSHLGVMSQKVHYGTYVDFTNNDFPLFDFGTTLGNGFDYTGLAMKENYKAGYRACWAGDLDSNGKIKFSAPSDDQAYIFQDVLFSSPLYLINYDFAIGYYTGDFDMNGKAKYENPNDDKNHLFGQLLFYPLNTNFVSNFDFFIEQIPNLE